MDYEYKCCYCGWQCDGSIPFHRPPELCKICGCVDFEIAEVAKKREAENRAINKHDERLAEQESERIIGSCKKKWLDYIARKDA